MSKHILITVRWPLGGIRTYLGYMFNCAVFKNYSITILTPRLAEVELLRQELTTTNINFIETGESFSEYAKAVLSHIRSGNYDLIHSQGLSSALIAAIPAKFTKIPHITTLHYSFSEFEYPDRKSKLKLRIFEHVLALIDCIQPVSYSAADNLQQYLPHLKKHSDKITPILNGLDISSFRDCGEKRDLHNELSINNDIFIFGYMGRFMPPKGFKFIIDAVQNLDHNKEYQNKFVIVCAGSGDYIRESQKDIFDKGLSHYFHFLPFTTEVVQLLKSFDTMLMPSLQEACSVLAMEALAAGTPTIGTSCVGLGELLEGSPADIIPVADAAALSQSMINFIQNNKKPEFDSYAINARSRFDINHSAHSLDEIYQTLLLVD